MYEPTVLQQIIVFLFVFHFLSIGGAVQIIFIVFCLSLLSKMIFLSSVDLFNFWFKKHFWLFYFNKDTYKYANPVEHSSLYILVYILLCWTLCESCERDHKYRENDKYKWSLTFTRDLKIMACLNRWHLPNRCIVNNWEENKKIIKLLYNINLNWPYKITSKHYKITSKQNSTNHLDINLYIGPTCI